ncbi:MFS transporter [Chania multitudinisentens RB-25]|uniref:MFS transporter n=1 Tax=Chania multitudinisentens RB-25 TaxID=1441930 RepID=W0L820_9GAMM|nr:oligosaccharide MFS transporter [Chania multitudinisentens]AHG18539.1 MFS transporter [Chania multitudinisentens RB-25]
MKINMPFSNDKYRYSSGYLLFFFAAWSLWWSFYAMWLKNKLGLSGTEVGMLYSVNQFFSMIFMIAYGFLQDKLGTRKPLIWLIGVVITLSGPFLIYVYEPLLISSFKLGMMLGAVFFGLGYLAGYGLVDSFVEKISRRFNFEFGTARFWGCLGYAVGTFVGGIFFSINPHINFWCVSVMGVLFLIVNLLFKTEGNDEKVASSQVSTLTKQDFITIFKDSQFWFFVIFVVGTWSFYNIYDQQMFPVFYAGLFENPEMAPRVYGYLNSVQVILEAIGMALIPFLINRIGPKSALLLGGLIMTCRILGSAIFTDIYIISFIKMLHALEVPLFVISVFKFSVANFDKRLSSTMYLVGFNIASSIGIIVLSLPIGQLFDKIGYQSIFFLMAGIVILTIFFGYFTLSKKKHEPSVLEYVNS